MLHEFRFRFSRRVEKRFRRIYWMRESEINVHCSQKPVDVSRKNLLFRKTFLDSTCFCLKPTRRVSPYLSDLEVNWTSSFLAQSDKLVIIPHLLLAPVGTVVRPAEHEFAHRLSPSPETVSRCSQQNRRKV